MFLKFIIEMIVWEFINKMCCLFNEYDLIIRCNYKEHFDVIILLDIVLILLSVYI